ncbi:MAG: right-handed parallel beta-helix repeat-containing protein [Pseudomonadales bacterium]|nr:right-handed parallel beta-helix repeat-containing protein [Pseudomonadales bacterium]
MSNIQHFGAVGDGIADDTDAIIHAIENGDGHIELPAGTFRITRTIEVDLTSNSPLAITGAAGATTIVMDAAGPAIRLVGTHGGTGDPGSRSESVVDFQRMPVIADLKITGSHPLADGIQCLQTMQIILRSLLITEVRHGVHLFQRNRNVIITHCHIYFNSGVGVYLDRLNLHQINISDNHISYNRQGGIRIENSEIRNLQITGNDIEYNNFRAHDADEEPTAEIYIDTTAENASVNEVTIASNTIQATNSVGGANIRIKEEPNDSRRPGLFCVTGNVIGSQEHNVHLTGCYGMVFSGNTIYSATERNLLMEKCSQITLGSNLFRRHTPSYGCGVLVNHCQNILFSGCTFEDEAEAGQESGYALLEIEQSQFVTICGNQIINSIEAGIKLNQCTDLNITGNTIIDTRELPLMKKAVSLTGKCQNIDLTGNLVSGIE